jgi:hypothetical protein
VVWERRVARQIEFPHSVEIDTPLIGELEELRNVETEKRRR